MDETFVSVKVDDEELGDQLRYLELEESDTLADTVRLTFGDDYMVLADVLIESQTVEIDLGTRKSHSIVFRGPITSVRGDYPSGGLSTVELEAADGLIGLSLQPKTHCWKSDVAQIVNDIATAHQLSAGKVDAPASTGDPVPQHQVEETDLAFLYRLAADLDCKLFIDHTGARDSLNFVRTQSLLDDEASEVRLVFDVSLESFAPRFDAFATRPEDALVTTDPKSAATVTLREKHTDGTEGMWRPDANRIARLGAGAARVGTLAAKSAGKRGSVTSSWRRPPRAAGAASRPATDRAGVLGDSARRLGQTGHGRTAGNVAIRPRCRLELEGYGGRWSGTWYAARVRHVIDVERRSFLTSFICTR
jgi:phage protein D